jgi:hypothetical protein
VTEIAISAEYRRNPDKSRFWVLGIDLYGPDPTHTTLDPQGKCGKGVDFKKLASVRDADISPKSGFL